MKIFDLFSKRRKRERGETPDIFTYDQIPKSLRVQIIHIWRDGIGENYQYPRLTIIYKKIHDSLCREYGIFSLINEEIIEHQGYEYALAQFFLDCKDNEKVLDVIELVFRFINSNVRDILLTSYETVEIYPDDAIKELNARFLEHGIGYEFQSGQIIRKNSEVIHREAVKPALNFLTASEYKGANEEFLKAHEHYRHKRYKECLNECLKSFESVIKTICDKRRWSYNQNDTAKKLIEICFSNDLIPNYLQSQFTALKSVLESGVPTARNKTSGHGQGITQAVVPDYFARYVLNLTATTILFLVEAEKELP